jgi:hypothetical protein
MPTAVIKTTLDSGGIKRGSAEAVKSITELIAARKTLTKEFSNVIELRGARELVQVKQQVASQSRQLAQAQRSLQMQQQATSREIVQAERGLLSLRSSLGGSERAVSQMTIATQRLQTAQRAGLVSGQEVTRLTGLMTQTFSASAVSGRDLRVNMAGMNTSLQALSKQGFMPIISAVSQASGATSGLGASLGNLLTFGLNPIAIAITAVVAGIGLLVSQKRAAAQASEEFQRFMQSEGDRLRDLNDEWRVMTNLISEADRRIRQFQRGTQSAAIQDLGAELSKRESIRKALPFEGRFALQQSLELLGVSDRQLHEIRSQLAARQALHDASISAIERNQKLAARQPQIDEAKRLQREIAELAGERKFFALPRPETREQFEVQKQLMVQRSRELERVHEVEGAIDPGQRALELAQARVEITKEEAAAIALVDARTDEALVAARELAEFREKSAIAAFHAEENAVKAKDALIQKFREEREAMGLDERERFIQQTQRQLDLTGLNAEAQARYNQEIREAAAATFDLTEEMKRAAEAQKETDQFAQEIARSFDVLFVEGIRGAKSMGDVWEEVGDQIQRAIIKAFVVDPLNKFIAKMIEAIATAEALNAVSSGIGSFFGGIGSFFGLGGGGSIPGMEGWGTSFWAKGGVTRGLPKNTIIDRPTFFPSAHGGLRRFAHGGILAGEQGTEAIMPLVRGRSGNLGVRSEGEGNVQIVNVYNNSPNVEVKTRTRDRGPGRHEIDVMIDERMAGITRAGGKFTGALEQRFGLNRRPLGR